MYRLFHFAAGLVLAAASSPAFAQDHDHARHDEAHDVRSDVHDAPPPFGFDLTQGWFDPWPHAHYSRRGTPRVHTFNLEPAFLGRDLLLDYRFTSADEETEIEVEAELEWAFTRRIGMVFEVPFVQVNPEEGETEEGLGDIAFAPRVLLAETERMLISANLEVSLPTGSESKGLGGEEAALGPSIATWIDFGRWLTFTAAVGTEHGLESGDSVLAYGAALIYTFKGPAIFPGSEHAHGHHVHFPPGMTSLIAELTGERALSGEDDGDSVHSLLLGVTYAVSGDLEIRGGYEFPLGSPEEFDDSFVLGLIYHF
jgi:hypothetical protein